MAVMGKSNQRQAQKGAQPQIKAPKKLSFPTVIHPDLYQRANFTLQASAFLQQLNLEASSSDVLGTQKVSDDNLDARGRGSDSERLARNMMAANGKMIVHNQLKLLVLFHSAQWDKLISETHQLSATPATAARLFLSPA